MLKNNSSRFVGLRATADGSLLRAATFNDKSYIVVPIVSAVGDEVWWPANSNTPELVPADVLESAYWSRNNRPIVAGHPKKNGEYISANSPDILEQYAYGFTCNSQFDNKRVKIEAWFDKEMAKKVGPAAENAISRLENGEMIEVSEGNMVISEAKDGELGGKKYYSVWLSAINDHLAVVSEGACNNEMGCGGPRVNQSKERSEVKEDPGKGKFKDPSRIEGSDKKNSMFRRMFASMAETIRASMSNNDLRRKLFDAVLDASPGVSHVIDEDVEAGTFLYCVVIRFGEYWNYEEVEYHHYRRTFTVDSNGVVSIGDSATEVEWFEGWRDKSTSAAADTELTVSTVSESDSSVPCSCRKETETVANVTTATVNETKKVLVGKLIGASKSPFDEADRSMLEGMKDEKLTSLMSAYEGEAEAQTTTTPAPVIPETAVPVVQPNPNQVVLSKEEYEEIKASSNAHKAQIEAHKSSLISSLKSAQTAFTEEHLKKMDVDTLERLAQSLNVNEPATVDYSVRGRAESRVASAPAMRELPDTWGMNKTN